MTVVENESGAKQCTLEPAQRMTRDNSTGLDNKHTFVTFIHSFTFTLSVLYAKSYDIAFDVSKGGWGGQPCVCRYSGH